MREVTKRNDRSERREVRESDMILYQFPGSLSSCTGVDEFSVVPGQNRLKPACFGNVSNQMFLEIIMDPNG